MNPTASTDTVQNAERGHALAFDVNQVHPRSRAKPIASVSIVLGNSINVANLIAKSRTLQHFVNANIDDSRFTMFEKNCETICI